MKVHGMYKSMSPYTSHERYTERGQMLSEDSRRQGSILLNL